MMDALFYFTPWLLVFVYMALWLQAARHRKNAWALVDDWRSIAGKFENAYNEMRDANQRLERVIEQYKQLTGSATEATPSLSANPRRSAAQK